MSDGIHTHIHTHTLAYLRNYIYIYIYTQSLCYGQNATRSHFFKAEYSQFK